MRSGPIEAMLSWLKEGTMEEKMREGRAMFTKAKAEGLDGVRRHDCEWRKRGRKVRTGDLGKALGRYGREETLSGQEVAAGDLVKRKEERALGGMSRTVPSFVERGKGDLTVIPIFRSGTSDVHIRRPAVDIVQGGCQEQQRSRWLSAEDPSAARADLFVTRGR
jgi:hypothetical protein